MFCVKSAVKVTQDSKQLFAYFFVMRAKNLFLESIIDVVAAFVIVFKRHAVNRKHIFQ